MRISLTWQKLFGPVIGILLIIYFVYHSIQGERGILSWFRIQQKLSENEATLSILQGEKEKLERHVYLLRPNSLDLDMLGERARAILNFADENEVIVYDAE